MKVKFGIFILTQMWIFLSSTYVCPIVKVLRKAINNQT